MTLLHQLAALLVIGWLPGAAIFRLPWAERDRRASLDAEERIFWAIVLSVAVSLSIVLSLAALHRYSFDRLLMGDVAIAGLAGVVARGRLRFGPAARRAGLTVQ